MMLSRLRLIALSGTVLAGMTTAAQADPISVAILGTIGLSASTIGATAFAVATSALTLTMSLGLSLVASMLNRPKKPVGGGTAGKLQAGGVVPRSIPIGRGPVTHSLVYANSDGRVSKTPNAVLTQVFALADVPVRGLAEIWVNGSKVTWTDTVGTQNAGGAYGYGIEIAEYPLHLFVKFYDGTQTAADSNLVSRFGSHPTRPYGSDRIGTGVAYAIVSCVVNSKYFSGFPQFKFVLDGAALYDPRQDSTAGGSGTQRWNDRSTWGVAPSNPMVQAYNLLRGFSYGSQWIYGGQTIGGAQLPVSAWAAAMNECDVAVSLAAGGSEAQFRAATELRFDEPPIDALKKLLAACNGRVGERGGLFKPKAGAATSAVFSITDEDILSDASSTFEPFRSLDAIVNGVTGKYIEPREAWNAKDAPPIYTPALETIDGGRRQTADLGFDAVTSATQVQRLMTAALADARRERRHQLPLPPDAFVLEPTDSISWTSARNGYVTKLFEIKSTRDLGGLLTGVSLSEVDPADYNWSTGNEKAVAISSTAPFTIPAQAIVDWNASAITLTGTDGSQLAGIRMTWDGTVEDIDGIQFEVWNDAQTVLIYEGSTDRYENGAVDITANIRPQTAYKVRGRYRPISQRRTVSWSGYISVMTPAVQGVSAGSVSLDRLAADVRSDLQNALDTADVTAQRILGDLQAARQSKDVHTLSVTNGDATARLGEQVTVIATDTGALSTKVTTLDAVFGDNSANTLVRYVSTAASGTAFSLVEFLARQTVGGTARFAGLRIGANNTSGFVEITAGQFFLTDPNWNSGVRGNILTWDTGLGTFIFGPPVRFQSTATFAAGIITTTALASGAVTERSSARVTTTVTPTNDNNTTFQNTSASVTVTTTATDWVDIFGQIAAESTMSRVTPGAMSVNIQWRLVRITGGSPTALLPDDSLIVSMPLLQGSGSALSLAGSDWRQFSHQDAPGAGTHTYQLQISAGWTGNTGGTVQLRHRQINVAVTKR